MRIGLLTGGGDCPGLNAAIRAVVKQGTGEYGHTIIGFRNGWRGVVDGDAVSWRQFDRDAQLHRLGRRFCLAAAASGYDGRAGIDREADGALLDADDECGWVGVGGDVRAGLPNELPHLHSPAGGGHRIEPA